MGSGDKVLGSQQKASIESGDVPNGRGGIYRRAGLGTRRS
jgi:hypothetical protein